MEYGKASSAVLRGVECLPIEVEVTCRWGLPSFALVGMADAAAVDARIRVKTAVRSAGFALPEQTLAVNVSPQAIKKRESCFDLAIAVALLEATGQVPSEEAEGILFVGELGLNGDVRPVRGLLAYALHARNAGLAIASAPCEELAAVEGLEVVAVRNLAELRGGLHARKPEWRKPRTRKLPDFADIPGCAQTKRALQIAAAGGHSVLLEGSDEWLSHALAVRLPSIMGAMTGEEALETAVVQSAAGLPVEQSLAGVRPFCAPHHSMTMPGLLGGGSPLFPGEASLAHNGVLYLSECHEFSPTTLSALFSGIGEGEVKIVRADGRITLPAKALIVASAHACPCGRFGSPTEECTCSEGEIMRWKGLLGKRLARFFDMRVCVPQVSESIVTASSAELADGVATAREFASWREERGLNPAAMDSSADKVIEWWNRLGAGKRVKRLKLARTIADIGRSEIITHEILAEALAWGLFL